MEERRRKLQDYLRRVVNFMLAKYPEFAQNTTPASAMSRIPLLAESSLAESGASSINAGAGPSAGAAASSFPGVSSAAAAATASGRDRKGDRSRAAPSLSGQRDTARASMGPINELVDGSGLTSRLTHQRSSLPSNAAASNKRKIANQPAYSGL